MAFNIRMGLPEMEELWNDLSTRKHEGKLGGDEEKFFKKLVKTLGYLAENPRHKSLASHEIEDLTRKYGFKIFQSYLEKICRPPAGFFGLMDRTSRTSQYWPLNRTPRIKNAALINA